MGQYFISGATSVNEAAAAIGEPPPNGRQWTLTYDGIWFSDPLLTDAECAALYTGFTAEQPGDDNYEPPMPPAVQTAIDTLTAFYNANPATVTDAQSATLHRATVVVLRWLNRSLGE